MGYPKQLRLKRHETFSIREGWLEKAINTIKEDTTCLSKDNGPKMLGLGTNMIKSLRYWLSACGIVYFDSKGTHITELGDMLYKYDPFLDDAFSLWMIHTTLVSNFEDAPVMNRIFNIPYNRFEKTYMVNLCKELFEEKGYEVKSLSSLDSDVSIMLKSYYSDDFSSPENNMSCPLAKLGLLSLSSNKEYVKEAPAVNSLDFRVVYYALVRCLICNDINISDEVSYNIEDLIKMEDNPMTLLNLSRSAFFLYLDEMKRKGFIEFAKTAGLNIVRIECVKSISDLFTSYYEEV